MTLEDAINEINISRVLDSACDGALESIQDQLDGLDISDDIKKEAQNEVFLSITISK